MEELVDKFMRKKDWTKALNAINEFLSDPNISKHFKILYLYKRSTCLFELHEYHAVVQDCETALNLLGNEQFVYGFELRSKLVRALCAVKRVADAEFLVKKWLVTNNSPVDHFNINNVLQKLRINIQNPDVNMNGKMKTEFVQRQEKSVVCGYCNISFADKRDLQNHCQSEAHQIIIMSDEGHDWHWRPPPRGFNTDNYSLCESWRDTGACRYGLQCVEAHGEEELLEWRERLEYRHMKLQRAYERELYGKSYTEDLLKKWVSSSSPDRIMCERCSGVEDICSSPLGTTVSTKNSMHEWIFTFKTFKLLHAVALLQDTYRNYFHIKDIVTSNSQVDIANQQEWILQNNMQEHQSRELLEHHVCVTFKTDIYGTFRQSVVFDFGTEPVLVKHLCVDVIPVTDIEKINEIKKEIIMPAAERWNYSNSEIVPFTSTLLHGLPTYASFEDELHNRLKMTYACPQPDTFTLSHATVTEKKLTPNNYRARMHELLYIEEMARSELVSKYNLITKLRITQSYLLSPNGMASSTAKYSSEGELFALMQLCKDLSEDTAEGRLILNNCHTVLLSTDHGIENSGKRRVYEALIEDKGKKMIYLRLSSKTVADLCLNSDSELQVQVQFQLNRIPYCEWHYAIDKIWEFKLIFPDTYLEPSIPWSPQKQWSSTLDKRLNIKQKEAIVAITTSMYVRMPPILIIGPFGTGKTFTLAQAVKELMQQPNNRVLICTHSNSAADLYVRDYLHPYVESGHEDAKPLRIFYHKRWVSTVHPIVQKYALIDGDGNIRKFKLPTLEDITKHRITVVTLSVSMYLSGIGLPHGFFTHILLDEAAQALECETIMPLALANENTRIVLAGDHMQLSPDLFSQFSKQRNLHISLLERLYDHYPVSFPCKILLCENYRAHEAIIHFTSESFYDQKLVAKGKQPKHDLYYPLTFFTTRGEDVQDQNSTAFYNNSEVYEVVERVCELIKKWPKTWGKIDEQSIGIVTPYSDQVFRIRSELRKRRMGGISVERVLNVQGKQFRAIFLSTVRTRRTCDTKKLSSDEVDYGFLSNSKLLNTAITRAQSLVAVVGDPVALCSVGRCSKVWERFIQICNENRSLFGITWSLLKSQLDGVELKKTYVLNPLAPEFIPRKYQRESYIKNPQVLPQNMIVNGNTKYFVNKAIPVQPFPVVPVDPNLLSVFCHIPPSPSVFFPKLLLPPPPVQNANFNSPLLNNSDWPEKPEISREPPPLMPFENGYPRNSMHPPNEAPSQRSQELIQFLNNVHFPEQIEADKRNDCTLNDYVNLLPGNMSLVDMLLQHHSFQERWFYHLLETKGIQAAKKFEYLIQATTKNNRFQDLPPHIPSKEPAYGCTQEFPQELPWVNINKPVNSVNMHRSVYMKDFDCHRLPPPFIESQPLYSRQRLQTNSQQGCVDQNITPLQVLQLPHAPVHDHRTIQQNNEHRNWQQQINDEFANLTINNNETIDDMYKRYEKGMTYASVLKSSQRSAAEHAFVREAGVLNGVSKTAADLTGPRLYQYFS